MVTAGEADFGAATGRGLESREEERPIEARGADNKRSSKGNNEAPLMTEVGWLASQSAWSMAVTHGRRPFRGLTGLHPYSCTCHDASDGVQRGHEHAASARRTRVRLHAVSGWQASRPDNHWVV